MTIVELKEKVNKLNEMEKKVFNLYYPCKMVSFSFYENFSMTIEHLKFSLVEKYNKEHYGFLPLYVDRYPYYNSFNENTTIKLSSPCFRDLNKEGLCYICTDITAKAQFGKVIIF
jgi:hypothetical protein